MSDMFTFRDSLEPESTTGLPSQRGGGADAQDSEDLTDFKVEATDGSVGKVMEASRLPGESYLLVDTGGTIFSKRVLLPAGVVDRIDRDSSTVYVSRTTDEIKQAPEFDEERYREATYREQLSGYYRR
jgi:hypothetical protein